MEIKKIFDIEHLAQDFMEPPVVKKNGTDAILLFDYESDTGGYKTTGITFCDTIEYRHTKEEAIKEYMIKAYNAVVEVINSNWVSKIKVKDSQYKHYLVYFDGFGAFEFLSRDVIQKVVE